ncbi:hypothetical protein EJ377_17415 [Chryseobacterium arthrosphaerae]|uniref:Uncharacterized protein n=1 Tax=Chryseobacterium arthrosphaerae TaxID=651561 RepID=A0A432DSU6_9FLAO|nr:hypothetical protein EJ377_17415 [Chryseobacterium arthrosphaerae]
MIHSCQKITYEKISSNSSVFSSGTIGLYAQKTADKDHYTFEVQNEEGDLNKDQRKDKVVIEMDIKDETRPLRVQIFLSQLIKSSISQFLPPNSLKVNTQLIRKENIMVIPFRRLSLKMAT